MLFILILVRHLTVLYFLGYYLICKTVVSLVNNSHGYQFGFIYHMVDRNVLFKRKFSSVRDDISEGSVFVPILFPTNDDDISIFSGNTTVKLFTDDIKLYCIYNAIENCLIYSSLLINLSTVLNCDKSKST